MSKPILFVDFDDTIVNTTKAFCAVYNKLYKYHPDFVPAKWQDARVWNFVDQCPLANDVPRYFEKPSLFDNLEFINPNTYETLSKLKLKYQIVIVSIGTYDNIGLKSQWIKNNLPFIEDSILIKNSSCQTNKRLVNMSGDGNVFIDDHEGNLNSVTVDHKIAFGAIREWNENWDGDRCLNWTEIERLL